jgi:hypothetical protein
MDDDDDQFNPRSHNAMFATILSELKDLKSTTLRIEEQTIKTNGRVTSVEKWMENMKVRVALASFIVAGLTTVALPKLVKLILGD